MLPNCSCSLAFPPSTANGADPGHLHPVDPDPLHHHRRKGSRCEGLVRPLGTAVGDGGRGRGRGSGHGVTLLIILSLPFCQQCVSGTAWSARKHSILQRRICRRPSRFVSSSFVYVFFFLYFSCHFEPCFFVFLCLDLSCPPRVFFALIGSSLNQKLIAVAYFDNTISLIETKSFKVI